MYVRIIDSLLAGVEYFYLLGATASLFDLSSYTTPVRAPHTTYIYC